jgi:SAM-dependent methyltransferase
MSTAPSNDRSYPTVDYDTHARTCAPDAFWAQVKRTVHGQPVSEVQIALIVAQIETQLALRASDVLLDLACGNGALTHRLADSCAALFGVDISTYLIDVARKHFGEPPRVDFAADGVVQYLEGEAQPERFTKALCYGSFMYFSDDDARATLKLLNARFSGVETFFLGNLPDRDRVDGFYSTRAPAPGELDDPQALIGIWRTRDAFAAMADDAGWDTAFVQMPEGFYSTHYRYDAVLRRKR